MAKKSSDTETTATDKPPRSRVAGAVRAEQGKHPPRPGKTRGTGKKRDAATAGAKAPGHAMDGDTPTPKTGRRRAAEIDSARAVSGPAAPTEDEASAARDEVRSGADDGEIVGEHLEAAVVDAGAGGGEVVDELRDGAGTGGGDVVREHRDEAVGAEGSSAVDDADAPAQSDDGSGASTRGVPEAADDGDAPRDGVVTDASANDDASSTQDAQQPVEVETTTDLGTEDHSDQQEHAGLVDVQTPAAETLTAADLLQPEVVQALEFAVKQQDLKAGMAAVVAMVPTKTTLPVLHCIAITAEGPDHIRLTATDLDTTVTFRIPAVVAVQGAILVAGKKLNEIASEIPDGCVINFVLKETEMRVGCDKTRTKYRLPTVPFEEFPTPRAILWEDHGFAVSSTDIGLLIGRTSFATSTEETRPILNGVLWEFGADEMAMVATNGHRLSSTRLAAADTAGRTDVIIHPRALAQVTRLAAEGDITVARTENHVGFRGEGWELITRTMAGPYPDYRTVIPTTNNKTLRLDMVAFRGALRRMAIVTSDQTHRIKMSMGYEPDMMTISVETPDVGTASEEVPVTYEGEEPLDIGFNVQYLLEFLRYTPPGEVRMTFKGPEGAAILEPSDDDSGAATQMLVMPLRLLA